MLIVANRDLLPRLMGAVAFIAAAPAVAAEAPRYDAAKYSQQPTACDVLAAHPDDPGRVAPGRTQKQIAEDYPGAIAACRSALERDPENPRLHYQLARVLGYSGQGKLAMPHRARAIEARYPQGLFVNGFLYLTGQNENPKDVCRAAELIRASAIEGRLAGQLGYPYYLLKGSFAGCQGAQADKAELLGFLDAAQRQVGSDFYQGLLIDLLRAEVNGLR
jgi:tetratricopeptide (TPR) repeat protein